MHVVNLGWFFIDKPEFMDLQAKRLPGFMQNTVSMIFPVEYLFPGCTVQNTKVTGNIFYVIRIGE